MPRHNGIRRADGKICIVINSVQHTLTIPAFVELMGEGLRVLQSIEKEKGDARNTQHGA